MQQLEGNYQATYKLVGTFYPMTKGTGNSQDGLSEKQ